MKKTVFSIITAVFVFSIVLTINSEIIAQENVNFSGNWNTDWGTPLYLQLKQRGSKVIGLYTYRQGRYDVIGQLRGIVAGNRFNFEWREKIGGRYRGGRGYFVLSMDGKKFTGRWGNGSSSTNGGPWNGYRAD